jgi:predicted HTH transcriptional regulator
MQETGELRLQKAASAKRENKRIEFIDRFDPKQTKDWCEIVKEIVAIANSGGGAIVIGVRNDGSPSTKNISAFLELDPARITDQIAKYTDEQFDVMKTLTS